jgi:hypothetical protein
LEIRDHLVELQVAICFDKSSTADLRSETVIPLAAVNEPTDHSSSLLSSYILHQTMLSLLQQTNIGLSLNSSCREVSSDENHLQLLDGHLQVSEAPLHGVAEIQHLERPLHFFLQPLPMCLLVAMQAYDFVDTAVYITKPSSLGHRAHTVCMVDGGEDMTEVMLCRASLILILFG